jgi:hypothetical protein
MMTVANIADNDCSRCDEAEFFTIHKASHVRYHAALYLVHSVITHLCVKIRGVKC